VTIVRDLPDADYRATPALSYSGAKDLMRSPALFDYRARNPRPPKTDFELGHAAHRRLLGAGADLELVLDEDGQPVEECRTKHARGERDRIRAAGRVPLTARQSAEVDAMVRAVRAHRTAGGLLEPGRFLPEVSIFWRDEVEHRARLDALLVEDDDGRPAIVDVKTTSADELSLEAIAREIAKFRYHWQDAHYLDGLLAHGISDARFRLVFIMKDPPHLVRVVEPDADAEEVGRRWMRAARDLYARCLDAGAWPAYPDEVALAGLPRYTPRHPVENDAP
jgi:hypothetical protein